MWLHPSPDASIVSPSFSQDAGQEFIFLSWHGNGKYHFYSHPVGQYSVLWPHFTAKEAGNCNVACVHEENRSRFGKSRAVSATVIDGSQGMPPPGCSLRWTPSLLLVLTPRPSSDLVCSIPQHGQRASERGHSHKFHLFHHPPSHSKSHTFSQEDFKKQPDNREAK